MPSRRGALLLAALLAVPLAGCLEIPAAHVPADVLETRNWRENATAARSESAWAGFDRTEVRVYEHPRGNDGYAGHLQLATLRAYLEPDEAELRNTLRDRVRAQAESQGIELEDGGEEGSRDNADGRRTFWFTQPGTARSEDAIFTRNADVRILGEVWNCREARVAVVAVGLAQVSDVRSVGGIQVPQSPDYRTWAALVADPDGTIEGHAGRGLVHRAVCS